MSLGKYSVGWMSYVTISAIFQHIPIFSQFNYFLYFRKTYLIWKYCGTVYLSKVDNIDATISLRVSLYNIPNNCKYAIYFLITKGIQLISSVCNFLIAME